MAQFTLETVDGPARVRGQCCVALDKTGNPRIAYAAAGGDVRLARRNAGVWTIEDLPTGTIVAPSDVDRVCLEIDSKGQPHIAYVDNESGHLLHGVRSGDGWTLTPVPTSLFFGDPRGVVHIALKLHPGRMNPELLDAPIFGFHDLTSVSLGYTRHVNGKLKPTLAASTSALAGALDDSQVASTGMCLAMAFDRLSESLHLAYTSEVADVQRLRRKRILDTTAAKLSEADLLESGRFVVGSTSIAKGTASTCVAFVDVTNQAVKAWVELPDLPEPSKELVAANVAGTVPSVAQNRGEFRLAYSDNNTPKLATRDRFGAWSLEVIDPDGGTMPSLAYDNLGNAHVAYVAGGTLKYATRME
jgi:hypothetical protein